MAETLSKFLKKLQKQLEVLETPEAKKAQESIDQSLKAMKNIGKKKRKGGLVSRKRGGKIIQGYKAGGKV
jgi:ABC-type enterochelin transport system substrate-binding protein